MRILIAIDNSECSEFAIEEVFNRNWGSDVQCRIVTVIEPVTVGVVDPMYVPMMEEAQREHICSMQKIINAKADRLKERWIDGQITGEVLIGLVAESIIEEGIRWKADLIVLGSHGKKGIQKFLLGSISEKVAIGAHCPVEIVKSKPAPTLPTGQDAKTKSPTA